MATPQQPSQQPIYPRDLNLALDRNFAKFSSYTDGRYEQLAAQIRIGNEESLIRDNDLIKQIQIGNEESVKRDNDLANAILRLGERVSNIETTLQEMRQEMREMRQEMKEMRQEMKDGFAAQAERHNELMVRVEKLERNG